jgi:pSer/pThr/pTyr-binding forkhead associated (FHA) protein
MSRKVSKNLPSILKVTNGTQAGVAVPLGAGILIGRSGDCQLILDDDYASTRHARLTLTPSGYQVEDLGSTNGTFVNNQRISTPTPLGLEDGLRIGRTLMSLER